MPYVLFNLDYIFQLHFYLQHVSVMLQVQAVYNVLTQPVYVPAIVDTRVPNVRLHVIVILLVQVVHHVISRQVNVHAILDTQEPHVILVTSITTKQTMVSLAQVSLSNSLYCKYIKFI